ncbi:CLUMA_CG018014, isoform A, partial [Clunio marinus]
LLLQNIETNNNDIKWKRTPPLARSKTLPDLFCQDQDGTAIPFNKDSPTPCRILQKAPKIALTIDDIPQAEFQRRKSSGSSVHSNQSTCEPHIYEFQEYDRNADSSLVIRIPSYTNIASVNCEIPQKLQNSTNSTFYRFTRLLNNNKPVVNTRDERRTSWEKRTSEKLPHSSSIDSLVDIVWNNESDTNLLTLPKHLMVQEPTSRRESLLSPRRSKQSPVGNARCRRVNSLFSNVEHNLLDKVRSILENTDVDVNSVNSDGLSALDIAVLMNNKLMAKLLLQHGALPGPQSTDNLENYLNSLMYDAEQKLHHLAGISESAAAQALNSRASFSSIIGSTSQSCTGTESERQMGVWERRIRGLRRLLSGWQVIEIPGPPLSFTIDVIGTNSVMLKIIEPMNTCICTKFKVQWSSREDFSIFIGERIITEWNTFQGSMGSHFHINELIQGRQYFFRACSGNVKGFGAFKVSNPISIIPSSWRDIELQSKEQRFMGRQKILDELFTATRMLRPEDACLLPDSSSHRRNPKKKTTIKQLFSAASKFQRSLRRGIYLACILFCDDKIFVTNEDFLPVIEIDETYPSNLNNDYYWLMKDEKSISYFSLAQISCTWDDVKLLRTDMEKKTTSAMHFRTKLLTAIYQMQSALGITDLGQFFHKPLKDSHGTVVLSCILNVKNPKIFMLNSRWVPLNKLQKKVSVLLEDSSINEILLSGIPEQINYYQTSTQQLSRGLYLGYLKMHSSFDTIQVVVPTKTPNNLPHVKVRDNPHVSAEEWNVIKSKDSKDSSRIKTPLCLSHLGSKPTNAQQIFLESLKLSIIRLINYLNISTEEVLLHRLYDVEVIELNHDVSFLIICPSAENAIPCAVPGQTDLILKRSDLMCLPLIVHEMIHLRTYQPNIIQKYARLSCVIELDMMVANHKHREAFSSNEVEITKEKLGKLQDLMNKLNLVWKSVRWLMDVVTYARSKEKSPELDMKRILEFNMNLTSIPTSASSHLLELPTKDARIKSPTRGSWPGPVQSNHLRIDSNSFLSAEHSKSEQQLPNEQSFIESGRLSVASCLNSSRKNSGDSNYYSSGEIEQPRTTIPPSKSEETLFFIKKKGPTNLHHRKRTNIPTTHQQNHNISSRNSYSIKTDSLNVDVQNESYDKNIATPKVLVSPSSSIFSTTLYKRNSKKHLLE